MNFSRDEVRRQLRAANAEHQASMGPWQEALKRIFGGDDEVPGAAKAQLLGVPTRRGFLKIGGATVFGAAVLAACGSDAAPDVAESGAGAATTTTADPAVTEFDTNLLRTATSLEILAVNTYQTGIDSGLIGNADVLDAFTLFRDQHDDHRGALQQATEDYAGTGTAYEDTNRFLQDTVITPALDALTDEESLLNLALRLETLAAESYVWAAGELSTTRLRQAIMGIGGTEGRHQAVLRQFLDDDPVPEAFEPEDDHITEDAYVGAQSDTSTTDTTTGGDSGGSSGGSGNSTTTTTGGDATTTTTAGDATTTTTAGTDGTTTTTAA